MKILAAFVLICTLPTQNLCVPSIQNGTDIVTYPFHMADVGGSEEDTDREGELMTNINHCLDGYNIFTGNPTPINAHMDPGYKSQIFRADFEKHRLTGDRRYLQPDGVDIRDCSGSCRIDFKTTEISGEKTYQKSLTNKVTTDVGGSFAFFKAAFSASADFSDTQDKTTKEGKIITQSTATCCSYTAKIKTFNPPLLTEDFKTAVERLPQNFNDEYFKFIDYFGTHYIHQAEYGALYGMQSEISRKDWTTLKNKGRNIAVGASATVYEATVEKGNGKFDYKYARNKKDTEEFKKHSTNRRTFSIGELPPRSGDVMDWVQEAKKSPAPMRLELGLISNILGNPSFKFKKPISSAIKENMEKALKEYCPKWFIKTAKFKYPKFSCSEPQDKGFPVTALLQNQLNRFCQSRVAKQAKSCKRVYFARKVSPYGRERWWCFRRVTRHKTALACMDDDRNMVECSAPVIDRKVIDRKTAFCTNEDLDDLAEGILPDNEWDLGLDLNMRGD